MFTCKAASQIHEPECMRGGALGGGSEGEGVHSGRIIGALLEDAPLAAKYTLGNHAQPLLHHATGVASTSAQQYAMLLTVAAQPMVIGVDLSPRLVIVNKWRGRSQLCCIVFVVQIDD